MKNGIKQLLRTPIKTGLLFLLLLLSTVLFIIGINLWIQVTERVKAADESFVTIGTVTQKENSLTSTAQWDAALKDYIYFDEPVYSEILSVDILKNLDIDYISEPEQRPYYGARSSDFITTRTENMTFGDQGFIGEISPLEDCIPDKPVKVKVEKILWGDQKFTGKTIFFCDHISKNTQEMKKGRTYLASLHINPFNSQLHTELDGNFEYMPAQLYQEQSRLWYDISDDFYKTDEGKIWSNMSKWLDENWNIVPVTPTSDLQLIPAFHEGEAIIIDGRTINADEFTTGEKVCLVSQNFAELNHFKVGDSFELQFYFIDYKNPVNQVIYSSGEGGLSVFQLQPDGKPYDIFQTAEYKIVGIYSYSVVATDNQYTLGTNQIFIPSASVVEKKENIYETGPMQGYNTSFRIKNGSINQAIEKLNQLPESEFLKFQFYDDGYEQVASGLQGTKIIAGVLFIVGLALALGVIVFILYFMIIKQKRRIAIERALGTSKRQCIISLMSGIIILTVMALSLGVAIGDTLATKVQKMAVNQTESFDTTYTVGMDSKNMNTIELDIDDSKIIICEGLTVVGGTSLVIILSLYLILQNLKEAPIYLLGRRDN